jgi:acetate kinase
VTTTEFLLALNAGSSSVKFALFEIGVTPRRVEGGSIERLDRAGSTWARTLGLVLERIEPHGGLPTLRAVGHRIVHGGARFHGPRLLTQDVLEELGRLTSLDPDHLPSELALVEALRHKAPDLHQVACFDTAFHRTMPRVARLVPIPRRYQAAGVERYGFHGLSYTFLLEELSKIAGDAAARARVVMAHLGSGASLVALRDGRSIETTMGFTPASGIPMGTRSGDLDPGVLVHLLRTERATPDALDELVNRRSGLLGVSETSSDMRDLLACESKDPRAADAIALFCYRARLAVGALAASIGGIDTLVFSGGIGEKSAPVRARIVDGLEHLGMELDNAKNDRSSPIISSDSSRCTIRVIPTDEQLILYRQTICVLDGAHRVAQHDPTKKHPGDES